MNKSVPEITSKSLHKEVLALIFSVREKKGQEKLALKMIDKALKEGHGYVIELFLEKALVYQHLVMAELSKSGLKQNKTKLKDALFNMEASVKTAEFYIEKYNLLEWKSRLYRFWGRVYDYKNDYKKSIHFYKEALELSKKDPEYVNSEVPRSFEIEAFLFAALIMVGKVSRGYKLAKDLYKRFDDSKDGKNLKKRDYFTWAVWRTGIPIRVISALFRRQVSFNKEEAFIWLDEAKKLLNPIKSIKIEKGDRSFQFRKDEIALLMSRLKRAN